MTNKSVTYIIFDVKLVSLDALSFDQELETHLTKKEWTRLSFVMADLTKRSASKTNSTWDEIEVAGRKARLELERK